MPYQSLTELGLSAQPGTLLYLDLIDRLFTETDLRTPALWLFGDHHEPTGVIESLRARGELNPTVSLFLGLRAMAERRFAEAEAHFRHAQERSTVRPESMIPYRILALAYEGRIEEAQELAKTPLAPAGGQLDIFWRFAHRRFGIEPSESTEASGDGS